MRFGALRRAFALAIVSSTLGHHALAQSPAEPDTVPWVEAPNRELSLSLGARVERGETHSGLLGFAALSVPLDRFVGAPQLSEATDKAAELPAVESGAPLAPPESVELAPLLAAAELSRLAQEVVAAALRADGARVRQQELDRIASRARLSAALPELRVRGQRSDDESLRLTPSTDDPYRYSVAGGRDWLLEAQLTFRLGRLVFADEELPIERLRIERERGAARTAAHVLARLLDWHRALSLAGDTALSPAAAQKLALDALEAEVELDVLTGGWFGERAARHHEPPARTADAPPPQKAPDRRE
jgi:hypothetical protein